MATEALKPEGIQHASLQTGISPRQTLSVLTLLITESCTIPFVARYRKEVTGGLDEVQIRAAQEAYEGYIEREHRREYILDAIQKMELMTPELKKQILEAPTLNVLEDLYAPFKSKKKTKGMLAREAGLGPLSELLLSSPLPLPELLTSIGTTYLKPELKITNNQEAIAGALDIIMESMSHDTEVKEKLRKDYWQEAKLTSEMRKEAKEVEDWNKFQDYFEFSQRIAELKGPKVAHRVLALRRGMTLKVLKVDVTYPEEAALGLLERKYFPRDKKLGVRDLLEKAAKKSYAQSIHPSLDLEIKTELKQLADEAAIDVFGINLKQLLLQPYLGAKTVLGVDPGVRTGCKLAVVDETGKFLLDTVIYPHPPQMDIQKSKAYVDAILEKFNVQYIAIGNGTYGRETLEFLETHVTLVKEGKVKATLTSEAGASIYSASDIAREEFPDKDPTVRGSISIARRFQDPLAELVKIDPKSIGVGQYQHDVNQAKLKKSLSGVVESCVNFVGVDLNTASAPLLAYVSGIGPTLAQNVVKYRQEKGVLKGRHQLLEVPRFTQKVYEQCAGFLRIYQGENPLDATFIHPERYPKIEAWAKKKNIPLEQLTKDAKLVDEFSRDPDLLKEIGEFTLKDIAQSLKSPSQDPRTEFKSTEFRKDMSSLNDLKIDEWYPGVVTNITQFGAFVDIGLKENGLLHISEISDQFVDNAMDVLKVGQPLKVKVISVDLARGRVSLSCKTTTKGERKPQGQGASGGGPRSSGGRRPEAQMPRPPVDQPLKNNAFAALKNLKV